MQINPLFILDGYKNWHHKMYPAGITQLYSNMTPRSYKHLKCDKSVFFGLQYYLKEYLIKQWQENFFNIPKDKIVKDVKRFHWAYSGVDFDTTHIEKLHDLGYMPLRIKALPEGSLVNEKIPYFTITNTHPDFAWLVNYLETQMSTSIWDLCVNATIAHQYKKLLTEHANKTCDDTNFIQWQGHDFAQRGRSSQESTLNQAGHLLSFTGTDTIPSIFMLEEYYNADITKELVGASVPASEHSVQTSYGKENELDSFVRILDIFPSGIVSVVSDSFDLWEVCTTFVTKLKDKILARDGKLVIRPDSGDPVDIICGRKIPKCKNFNEAEYYYRGYVRDEKNLFIVDNVCYDVAIHSGKEFLCQRYNLTAADKGVVELLWDVFGGTINSKGYKVLDSHIGVIYGDSISLERADAICKRLEQKGFASNNIVFGIGSYTYNYNTRDSLGIAVKSTYCVVDNEPRNIFKDPVTDNGLKKSARGLLKVEIDNDKYVLKDEVSLGEENTGELKTVYENGVLLVDHKLSDIRNRLDNQQLGW
jgi:nicotinamide phosphoribosyltransferase